MSYTLSVLLLRLFYIYPHSTIILQPNECNILNANEEFKHDYSLLNVFTRVNNEIFQKDSIKILLCCELLFSFLLNQTRALENQQLDTLLSDRLELEGLNKYCAKEPHRPQVTNSPAYIEVINFCGSQPCSPSREQRYYGLIELEPRNSGRKLFQNSTGIDEENTLSCS